MSLNRSQVAVLLLGALLFVLTLLYMPWKHIRAPFTRPNEAPRPASVTLKYQSSMPWPALPGNATYIDLDEKGRLDGGRLQNRIYWELLAVEWVAVAAVVGIGLWWYRGAPLPSNPSGQVS